MPRPKKKGTPVTDRLSAKKTDLGPMKTRDGKDIVVGETYFRVTERERRITCPIGYKNSKQRSKVKCVTVPFIEELTVIEVYQAECDRYAIFKNQEHETVRINEKHGEGTCNLRTSPLYGKVDKAVRLYKSMVEAELAEMEKTKAKAQEQVDLLQQAINGYNDALHIIRSKKSTDIDRVYEAVDKATIARDDVDFYNILD